MVFAIPGIGNTSSPCVAEPRPAQWGAGGAPAYEVSHFQGAPFQAASWLSAPALHPREQGLGLLLRDIPPPLATEALGGLAAALWKGSSGEPQGGIRSS